MILEELFLSLLFLVQGLTTAGCYHLLILFRNLIPHRHAVVYLEDFFFCACVGICFFLLVFLFHDGVIRLYMVAFVILGIAGYKILFSLICKEK